MFGFIKDRLQKIYANVTSKLQGLFSRTTVDDQTLEELQRILIEADTGISTTRALLTHLKAQVARGKLAEGKDLKAAVYEQLCSLLSAYTYHPDARIYLLVGVNGSGKTTFAGKLAHKFTQEGKKVLLVAGDTFRAAATQQLAIWARRIDIPLICGKENQDPGSLVFDACQAFAKDTYDVMIIDTAGRLQTKANLMRELEKIKRIISRQLPDTSISTLLTVDSMLGQNSLQQAKIFHESTALDGIVLTKMDGTGKGGVVFAITQELKIPIAFISFGEKIDQLSLFNPSEYVCQLLEG